MNAYRLLEDEAGSVLVETTVMLTLVFLVIFGGIDFLFAFYQWNAASKAVEIGARIAAVSDPVPSGLNELSATVLNDAEPGSTVPFFSVTCGGTSATTGTCTCDDRGSGACSLMDYSYNASAMNSIVYGRGNTTSCTAQAYGYYSIGMCGMFDRINVQNVTVTYTQTGLGYVGRPGGPVPTITVQLHDIPFQFFFLGALMGFGNIQIPKMVTTITGEDMSSRAPG